MTVDQALTVMGIVSSALLVGMGGAMAWFRSQRIKLEANIESLRGEMRSQMDDHHENDRDIAVLKTELSNHIDRLEEIKDATTETNRKLDQLSSAMTTLAIAVNRK